MQKNNKRKKKKTAESLDTVTHTHTHTHKHFYKRIEGYFKKGKKCKTKRKN